MTNLFHKSNLLTRRALLMIAAICLVTLSLTNSAAAQSTDRERPTPLSANVIDDEFHQDDPEYFYTFGVDAGVTVKFTLELKAKNYGGALYITLFDRNGRELGGFDKVVMKGQTAKLVQSVRFARAQDVLLRIYSGNGEGYYRLTLGDDSAGNVDPAGAQQIPPPETAPQSLPDAQSPAPVPTQAQGIPDPLSSAPIPAQTQTVPVLPAPASAQTSTPQGLTVNFRGLRFHARRGPVSSDPRALNPQPLPPKASRPTPPDPQPYGVRPPMLRITKRM